MSWKLLKIENELNKQISKGYINIYKVHSSTSSILKLKDKSLKTDEDVDRFIKKLYITTKNKNVQVIEYRNRLAFMDSYGMINSELEPLIYDNHIIFFLRHGFTQVTLEAAFKIDKNLNSNVKRLLMDKEV